MGNHCIGGKGIHAWGRLDATEEEVPPSRARLLLRLLRSIFWAGNPAPNCPDLARIRPRRTVDSCTRWVEEEWVPFYHAWRTKGSNVKGKDEVEEAPQALAARESIQAKMSESREQDDGALLVRPCKPKKKKKGNSNSGLPT
jgi:hypothetical protein